MQCKQLTRITAEKISDDIEIVFVNMYKFRYIVQFITNMYFEYMSKKQKYNHS